MNILDIIENNENQHIRVSYKENPFDDYDPMSRTIFDGMLKDIPDDLKKMDVVDSGWLVGAKCFDLKVPKHQGQPYYKMVCSRESVVQKLEDIQKKKSFHKYKSLLTEIAGKKIDIESVR